MSKCIIAGCGNREIMARKMCRAHYRRWYKHGDPLVIKRVYRNPPHCRVSRCPLPVTAKGLCGNHYALARRHGEPVRKKVFTFTYIKDGYRYVYVDYRHYEPEHRVVMEKMLGRKLAPSEHIHHKDGNPLNNSPSNLQIVSRSEHLKIHAKDFIRDKRGRRVQ